MRWSIKQNRLPRFIMKRLLFLFYEGNREQQIFSQKSTGWALVISPNTRALLKKNAVSLFFFISLCFSFLPNQSATKKQNKKQKIDQKHVMFLRHPIYGVVIYPLIFISRKTVFTSLWYMPKKKIKLFNLAAKRKKHTFFESLFLSVCINKKYVFVFSVYFLICFYYILNCAYTDKPL